MKVRVTATAPTIYQMNSLKTLIGSMPYKKHPDGSFYFGHEFPTKREASQWMKERAHAIAYDAPELKDMLAEINKYDTLTADGVAIFMEKVN